MNPQQMDPTLVRGTVVGAIALIGVLMMALPWMSNEGLLFGVPVPQGFRQQPEGKRSVRFYFLAVGITMIPALLITVWATGAGSSRLFLAGPLLLLAASLGAYFREYRRLQPFAVQPSAGSEIELSDDSDRLPPWLLLNVVPLLILGLAALYVRAHWDQLPERFPVHWGIDGLPNRWADKSFRGVYGPLILGAVMVLFFATMQVAAWYGARRRSIRSVNAKVLLASSTTLAALLSLLPLQPLLAMPAWVLMSPLGVTLLTVVLATRARRRGTSVEPTPNECWRGGLFYYNPNDAAIFVEKRHGFGYTFNFANGWAWAMMGLLFVFIAAWRFILR